MPGVFAQIRQNPTLKLDLSSAAPYLGLTFSSLAILTDVTSGLSLPSSTLMVLVIGAAIAAAYSGYTTKVGWPFWIAFSIAFFSTITSLLYISSAYQQPIIGVLVMVNIFAMLVAFRLHPIAYAALPLAVGFAFGVAFHSNTVGVVVFFICCGVLVLCNYMVQLVLDHMFEIKQIPRVVNFRKTVFLILQATALWAVALLLAILGFTVHRDIQNGLKLALYDSKLIQLDPSQQTQYYLDRSIESDLIFTTNEQERAAQGEFERFLTNASFTAEEAKSAIPSSVDSFLNQQTPKPLDAHGACRNASFKLRFGIRLSLGTLCRGIVNAVSSQMIGSYKKAHANINRLVTSKTEELGLSAQQAIEGTREEGRAEIESMYAARRAAISNTFLVLRLLEYLSYVILSCALLAALCYVLGRVLFDSTSRMVFRLQPDGTAVRLDASRYDEAKLFEFPIDAQNPYWYLWLGIVRRGNGTQMNLVAPQWFRCFVTRLFSGRLLLTRVDLSSALARSQNVGARISYDGDVTLVFIRIRGDLQVVFRMQELVGFSEGIKLKSVYSTHVGSHLLGLGSFLNIATGDGYLILLGIGEKKDGWESIKGDCTPEVNLLAWDRRHEFSLKQNLNVGGIWINEPSLWLRSTSGAALLDESRARKFHFGRRMWNLLRFLMMPF